MGRTERESFDAVLDEARRQGFKVRDLPDKHVLVINSAGQLLKTKREGVEGTHARGRAWRAFISRLRRIGFKWPVSDLPSPIERNLMANTTPVVSPQAQYTLAKRLMNHQASFERNALAQAAGCSTTVIKNLVAEARSGRPVMLGSRPFHVSQALADRLHAALDAETKAVAPLQEVASVAVEPPLPEVVIEPPVVVEVNSPAAASVNGHKQLSEAARAFGELFEQELEQRVSGVVSRNEQLTVENEQLRAEMADMKARQATIVAEAEERARQKMRSTLWDLFGKEPNV